MRDSRKTLLNVLIDNLFNLLNIATIVLCAVLILNKSYFYLIPLALSLCASIFNFALDIKHYLLSKKDRQKVNKLVDGNEVETRMNRIKVGDEIVLYQNQKITFVGKIKSGYLMVDEKSINGNPILVKKGPGSSIIRGAYIVEGNAVVEVTELGHRYIRKTPVQKPKIVRITRLVTLILSLISLSVLLGAWIFDLVNKTTSTVDNASKALILSLPCLLNVVLTIYLFVIKKKVTNGSAKIIDPMMLTELDEVDVVCLDKTGTITTGEFEIFKTVSLSPTAFASMSIDSSRAFEQCVSNIIRTTKETGGYFTAIQEHFIYEVTKTISDVSPFKKNGLYSAITIASGKTYAFGEVENFALGNLESASGQINQYRSLGYHVLALVESKKPLKSGLIDGKCNAIGLIILQEKIRENIKSLISYCLNKNIQIKVISGDKLSATYDACRKAGLEQPLGKSLANMPFEELESLVDKEMIFADASASQKAYIVKALKERGHKVLYIGDGTNDTQALKTANVAIAVGDSNQSVRKCSHAIIYDTFNVDSSLILSANNCKRKVNSVTSMMLAQSIFLSFFAIVFIIAKIFDQIIYNPFDARFILLWTIFGVLLPVILTLCEKDSRKNKNFVFLRQLLFDSLAFIVPIGIIYLLQLSQYNGVWYYSLPSDVTELHETLITSSRVNSLCFLMLVVISLFISFNHLSPFSKYRFIAFLGILFVPVVYAILLAFNVDSISIVTQIETSNLLAKNYFTAGFVTVISSSTYLFGLYLLDVLKGSKKDAEN